jgi:hypothetical protein
MVLEQRFFVISSHRNMFGGFDCYGHYATEQEAKERQSELKKKYWIGDTKIDAFLVPGTRRF